MELNSAVRDFSCSPQQGFRGLEEKEWLDCYRSGERIMELAHKVMKLNESPYLKLPFDDYVEAEAFGALVVRRRELPQLEYNSNNKNIYSCIHNLRESEPTKSILEAIRLEDKQPILLQIQAPFSILAYLLEPMNLYKQLRKDPKGVEKLLAQLVQEQIEYVKAALQLGVRTISVADPCASLELIGEKNYRSFAANPLFHMLQKLVPFLKSGVIHLCPRCSYPMEQMGYLKSQVKHMEYSDQFSMLLALAEDPKVFVTGHQCIHKQRSNQSYQFHLEIEEKI